MKNLADLKTKCAELGVTVQSNGRASKEPYIAALRQIIWEREHPGKPLPVQITPMLLSDWTALDAGFAEELERDQCSWIVQEKKDGVRVLLHVAGDGVRITGRSTSDVTYRLTEHQSNLSHLTGGFGRIADSVLDGELVCPLSNLNTGSCVTTAALQAAVAVLATSPENAVRIQRDDDAKLRLYVFDILQCRGTDVTGLPLVERLELLDRTIQAIDNPFIQVVPSFVVNKQFIHDRIIEGEGEGTVWKHAHGLYEPGRRVKHWIKRKRETRVEAFISDFKLGTPDRGHSHLVGAIEFSVRDENGTKRPIAWVSSWTDDERRRMTWMDTEGKPVLNPTYYDQSAVIAGQDESGRSKRLRHARLVCWSDAS